VGEGTTARILLLVNYRDAKEMLQTLAVIGKEFALGVARETTKRPDDELEHALQNFAKRRVYL
jgi:hypothetical protein